MQFAYKMTSSLVQRDITAMMQVLNTTFDAWGDEAFFQWKYIQNPYGDSLHMIGYDDDQPVATASFWRNDLGGMLAYQCVDLAVVPSHQRRGIFRETLPVCVANLQGAYLYTYPNPNSRPGFLNSGWSVKRKVPISLHLPHSVLKQYQDSEPIPDNYVEWRFSQHPKKQYFVYRQGNRPFLLAKRRKNCYAVGGILSKDFGFSEARPLFLLSYDFPNHPIYVPKRVGFILENPCFVSYEGFIPSYRTDTL